MVIYNKVIRDKIPEIIKNSGNSSVVKNLSNEKFLVELEKKLKEEQLDECPLTMSDLRRIKGDVDGRHGMMSVFRGIYHLRIEYPDQKEELQEENVSK